MKKFLLFSILNILNIISKYYSFGELNSGLTLSSELSENFNFISSSNFTFCHSQIINNNENFEVCGFIDRSRYACDNYINNCQFTFNNKYIASSNRGIIGYLVGGCGDFELNNLISRKDNNDYSSDLIQLFDIEFNNRNGRKCPSNLNLKEYKENIPTIGNYENVYVENRFYYKIRIKFDSIYNACSNPGIVSYDLSYNPLESLFENINSNLYPDNLILDDTYNCEIKNSLVCGFDGDKFKTYNNSCSACSNRQILGYYEGECLDENKKEDKFDEYFCQFNDRMKNNQQMYTTDSYPFVCAYSKYSKVSMYFQTRGEACSYYFVFKVISGLCPHHEEYFKDKIYYTCKNMDFKKLNIKNQVCGISYENGLQSAQSIESACQNGAIIVFEKPCPLF